MYALIETGGKQVKVAAGDKIKIEKVDGESGASITFDKVIAIIDDNSEVKAGTPYVTGASIDGKVLRQGLGKKVVAFHYKPKKRIRIKRGHRQPYTLVEINSINTGK